MEQVMVVCDVLVLKALETMGKWIVRSDRSRFRTLGDQPWFVAHTIWQADDQIVDKALRGAWDLVPVVLDTHACCDVAPQRIAQYLDQYVHDLVITGTPHTLSELRYRLEMVDALV